MFPEGRFFELLMVGALALIVVGPKDLPILMRKVGQFVGKMRGMAAEFRASFDELARQSELEELRREVEAMRLHQSVALNPPSLSPAAPGEMLPLTPPEHSRPVSPTVSEISPGAEAAPDEQPGLFDDRVAEPHVAPAQHFPAKAASEIQ